MVSFKNMKSSYQIGFTLIELIIVTVIIALFASMSLATINRFTSEKQLENESKKIISVLELIKTKTNAADATLCLSNPSFPFVTPTMLNYNFVTGVDGKNYSINPTCITGSTAKNITYKTNTGINISPLSYSLTFPPIYGKVKCTCFIIQSTTLSKCRYVKVSENAVIDESSCPSCSCTNCVCP